MFSAGAVLAFTIANVLAADAFLAGFGFSLTPLSPPVRLALILVSLGLGIGLTRVEAHSFETTGLIIVRRELATVLLLLAAVSLIPLVAGASWVAGLADQPRPQYAVGALVGAGAARGVGQRRTALAFTLLVLINVALVGSHLPRPKVSAPLASTDAVRVAILNVNTYNYCPGRVLDALRTTEPDLVVLHEWTRRLARALPELTQMYPQFESVYAPNAFGLAILSRYPLGDTSVARVGASEVPLVQARVEVNGRTMRLLTSHAPMPRLERLVRERDELVRTIAREARAGPSMPTLVLGDFNATPWSKSIQPLSEVAALRSATSDFGYRATWPASWGTFGLPIDHVYTSADVRVVGLRAVRVSGTDHRMLVADLALPSHSEPSPKRN